MVRTTSSAPSTPPIGQSAMSSVSDTAQSPPAAVRKRRGSRGLRCRPRRGRADPGERKGTASRNRGHGQGSAAAAAGERRSQGCGGFRLLFVMPRFIILLVSTSLGEASAWIQATDPERRKTPRVRTAFPGLWVEPKWLLHPGYGVVDTPCSAEALTRGVPAGPCRLRLSPVCREVTSLCVVAVRRWGSR
jgi:hypothetical protein